MWQGSFEFGDFWTAYRGATDQNSPHAHVALQLALGQGRDLSVALEDGALRAPAVLIAPLAVHSVAAGQHSVVFLYVEPQAPLGQALRRLCAEAPALELPRELADLVEGPMARAVERLGEALGVAQRPSLDARLARALGVLEVGGEAGVAAAARAAGLSESALRRLAQSALGTPLSRWSLWRKLERSARALAGGASLAEAAAAGPFADQAHLARTMRRMFGITPGEAARAVRSRPEGDEQPA